MSKRETNPHELFKAALGITTKAISEARDAEVSYANDAPHADGDNIVLRNPPRDLDPSVAARVRGEADALALRIAHHDPVAFSKARPGGDIPRALFMKLPRWPGSKHWARMPCREQRIISMRCWKPDARKPGMTD